MWVCFVIARPKQGNVRSFPFFRLSLPVLRSNENFFFPFPSLVSTIIRKGKRPGYDIRKQAKGNNFGFRGSFGISSNFDYQKCRVRLARQKRARLLRTKKKDAGHSSPFGIGAQYSCVILLARIRGGNLHLKLNFAILRFSCFDLKIIRKLDKENFSLKLRIFYLEERMGRLTPNDDNFQTILKEVRCMLKF